MNNTYSGYLSRAVKAAYARGEADEELLPRILVKKDGSPAGRIKNREPVIFYDIRGEREVELSRALTEPGFRMFDTSGMTVRLATMIQYDPQLDASVAFPPEGAVPDTLSETVSRRGLKHLKIMESEKAVHLSYFLNGRRNEPYPGEERQIIESPKEFSSYDQCPGMSASKVAEELINAMKRKDISLFIANFANVDVVGHIENDKAAIKAVEAVDAEIGKVVKEAAKNDIIAVITADHGTVEKWLYPEGTVDTGHTNSPVPFIIAAYSMGSDEIELKSEGQLADVAPTILGLMGIEPPESMTGKDLRLKPGPVEPGQRVLLIIADGWGYNPETRGNLIAQASTPVMDGLMREHPWTLLQASGEAVGLPKGTVGNSEAGHLHIGAGRIIYSDRMKIDKAVESGEFFKNPAFIDVMKTARDEDLPLHLLGIVSFYSSHGSIDHLFALMKMAKQQGIKELYIHALLGRRGERPESGARYTDRVEEECRKLALGKVVTVMGRYFALDREYNWDRVEKAYRALVDGEGVQVPES